MENNSIGLPKKESEIIVTQLNELLSDFQVYYQSLRGMHWNIKGRQFFELHLKFEEFYNDAQLKIDLIAERILTLEGMPLHTFEDYLSNSKIKVGKNINEGNQAIEFIVAALSTLLPLERNILAITDEINDEGTNAMISGFVQEQEKTLWMLRSWLV